MRGRGFFLFFPFRHRAFSRLPKVILNQSSEVSKRSRLTEKWTGQGKKKKNYGPKRLARSRQDRFRWQGWPKHGAPLARRFGYIPSHLSHCRRRVVGRASDADEAVVCGPEAASFSHAAPLNSVRSKATEASRGADILGTIRPVMTKKCVTRSSLILLVLRIRALPPRGVGTG